MKVLRMLSALGFTTVNRKLTKQEGDTNFIEIQQGVDALAVALAASTHTQNTDRYLNYGNARVFDSFKNFNGSFAATLGDDAGNTVSFSMSDPPMPPFSTVSEYELELWGWAIDVNGVYQKVEVGYKTKTTNGFIAMPAISCQVCWKVISNLRTRTGT